MNYYYYRNPTVTDNIFGNANTDEKDASGDSPLDHATQSSVGNIHIVRNKSLNCRWDLLLPMCCKPQLPAATEVCDKLNESS